MRGVLLFVLVLQGLWGQNQTEDWTPILTPTRETVPYVISIVQADFQLPSDDVDSYGLQSFVWGTYKGKALLLAGRTNGLHGFADGDDNFPIRQQNKIVHVVNSKTQTVTTRSLLDASAQLNQQQIDTLSVTAAEWFQVNNTLYVVGGYGVDTDLGTFSTKSTLTAIDIPKMIQWVETGKGSARECIRQTSHPLLQVTGGQLFSAGPHEPYLLVCGQNFTGYYNDSANGAYTQQIRPFKIIDNGMSLYIQPGTQYPPDPNYRRRDLSVVPIIQPSSNGLRYAYVVLSGVFTLDTGVWTVPIVVNADGSSSMADPSDPNTFKQGMNNYDCARTTLFSKETGDMYILLFGGLSYLSYSGGVFTPDTEIPFINSVTTVKLDSQGNFSQYVMENEYPTILSQFVNPGNTLLFGAEARFIPAKNLPLFPNNVFSLDELDSDPVLLGYIVGGIQSTLDNTNTQADSSASPYIFSVFIQRR